MYIATKLGFEYNDKSLPLGLYMVNYWDCKLIKIDDINRL